MDSKTRSKLNSLAMKLDPLVTIGKNGITETVMTEIEILLEARELLKIKVLKNADLDVKAVMEDLCEKTKADPVACVGGMVVIYRYSSRKDITHIKL